MKKLRIILTILCVSICLVSCTYLDLDNVKGNAESNGLIIEGEGKYKWFSADETPHTLYIMSDDVIVSGTAESDTLIQLNDDVESLSIKNLNQGEYKIEIWFPLEKDCKLTFEGKNTIYFADIGESLEVRGKSISDELIVTGKLQAREHLTVSKGTIRTSFLEVYENVYIKGKTKVYLEPFEHENDSEVGYYGTRLMVNGKLNIDLDKSGIVYASTDMNEPPIIAEYELKLGNSTVINAPIDGYIDFFDPDFDNTYIIYDSDGTLAKEIRIEHKEKSN